MTDFHYKAYGSGENALIFFHGFGEDHHVFDEMVSEVLMNNLPVKCYMIDIYYHGGSSGNNERLTKKTWEQSFSKFLDEEKIHRFTLVGFSLGGRFCISTAMSFPKFTRALILIAPDGIYLSPWYKIANSTLGNRIFKYLMDNPERFDQLINFCKWSRLAPGYLIRFTEKTLNTYTQRQLVYKTWTYFYPLQHAMSAFMNMLKVNQQGIYLILGEKDKLVPPNKILPKIRGIKSLEYHLIPAKHHQMITQSIPYVISILKNQLL